MRLVVAEGALLEEILDATYPIWSEGLTRENYARWNAAQMRTAWGREHLQRFDDVGGTERAVARARERVLEQ